MGADLIITYLIAENEKVSDKANWQKGYDWIKNNAELIKERCEEEGEPATWALVEDDAPTEEFGEHVQGALQTIQDSLGLSEKSSWPWRNVTDIWLTEEWSAGITVYILGDGTWGDAPEGYDEWALVTLVAPEALEEIGFVLGQSKELVVSIRDKTQRR